MSFSTTISKFIFAFFSLTVFTFALAHGENKPGPHGGFIQMPGAFHTEVVPLSKNSIKVFLLDMNWKNPIVTESSVVVTHRSATAKCIAQSDHFVCTFDKNVDLTKPGQLGVHAKRENLQGNLANYPLPLKR